MLQKMSFKIAGCMALAHCQSRRRLNLAVSAGWQLGKCVIQCLPSCRHQCEGRRDIANALIILLFNRCPMSSRVLHNLTINFSSSKVSSYSFSCVALLGCAPLSQSCKVPHGKLYIEAAAWIDGLIREQYACLTSQLSFSLSVTASQHFTLPMILLLLGESEN